MRDEGSTWVDTVDRLGVSLTEVERERDALGIQVANLLALIDAFEATVGEVVCDDPEDKAVLFAAREADAAHREGTLSALLAKWDERDASERPARDEFAGEVP